MSIYEIVNHLLFVYFLLLIQHARAQDTLIAIELQNQIDSIHVLQHRAAFPNEPSQADSCHKLFNVEDYFKIFTHLHLQAGWRINYMYTADVGGHYPVIIAYIDSMPVNIDSLKNRYNDFLGSINFVNYIEYLDHVVVDTTMTGFIQFVTLRIIGSQFALGWHANYNDETVVCTREAIDHLLDTYNMKSDRGLLKDVKRIDPAPWAGTQDDYIIVRLVTFTKWGGFFEKKYYLSKTFHIMSVKSNAKN